VTVNPLPICSISGDELLCPSSTDNIYSAPDGEYTCSWSITGNGSISGATNEQSVSVTAGSNCDETFTLTLTITNENGCSSTCETTVNVNDTTDPVFSAPADFALEG
jgi:hypothetical protein